jgi:hypothetical protein
MTPGLIRDLLLIATESNKWPRLKHLRDESIETITPVYVTNTKEENANGDPQLRSQ